jgi:hypothetical protein
LTADLISMQARKLTFSTSLPTFMLYIGFALVRKETVQLGTISMRRA